MKWLARLGSSPGVRQVLVRLVGWLLRGLFVTLRPEYVKRQLEQQVRSSRSPVLFTLWHGRMLYFVKLYEDLGPRVTILVSQSRDGEIVAQLLTRLGFHITRGSSSQGGARGLLAVVNKVRGGMDACFTPDGPRGPRYRVQPGLVLVAKRTGAAILPMTFGAQRKRALPSWDAFVLPLPFSRVVVIYGEPIYVPTNASTADLEVKRREVETSLRRITETADNYFTP
jgi:lysophospholipid acyltransferase (LPLAT)-like uncharacterized protein